MLSAGGGKGERRQVNSAIGLLVYSGVCYSRGIKRNGLLLECVYIFIYMASIFIMHIDYEQGKGKHGALLSPPHNFKSNICGFASESNLTVSPYIIWLKNKTRCIVLTL